MFTRLLALCIVLGLGSQPPCLFAAATIGQPAPPWQLHDLDGHPVQLSDFAGRVVLINFFRTTCVPCLWEIPDLTELQQTYGSQGLVIIGTAAQESAEILRPFVTAQNIEYLVCPSTDAVLWDYNVFPLGAIPLTVIIDRGGVVADWYRYYQTQEFHEEKILPLLGDVALPSLSIAHVDGAIEISWPEPARDFVLERRPFYEAGPEWTPVEEDVEVVGERRRVILPSGQGTGFFRLREL